jgi:hypothetical protein
MSKSGEKKKGDTNVSPLLFMPSVIPAGHRARFSV